MHKNKPENTTEQKTMKGQALPKICDEMNSLLMDTYFINSEQPYFLSLKLIYCYCFQVLLSKSCYPEQHLDCNEDVNFYYVKSYM